MNSMEFVVLEKELKKLQNNLLLLTNEVNNLQKFVIKLTEIIGQQLDETDKSLSETLKGEKQND